MITRLTPSSRYWICTIRVGVFNTSRLVMMQSCGVHLGPLLLHLGPLFHPGLPLGQSRQTCLFVWGLSWEVTVIILAMPPVYSLCFLFIPCLFLTPRLHPYPDPVCHPHSLPGGLVVRTLHSHWHGLTMIPGQASLNPLPLSTQVLTFTSETKQSTYSHFLYLWVHVVCLDSAVVCNSASALVASIIVNVHAGLQQKLFPIMCDRVMCDHCMSIMYTEDITLSWFLKKNPLPSLLLNSLALWLFTTITYQ